jgi:hypothetical protein
MRDPYIYTTYLIAILYGEKNYTHFKDAWLPLVYKIVTTGSFFNWETILSHSLNRMIERHKRKNPNLEYSYAFTWNPI